MFINQPNPNQLQQAALENVRCEELQLELKSTVRTRPSSRPSQAQSTVTSHTSSRLDQSSKYTTAASGLTGIMSHNSNNIAGLSSLSGLQSTAAKTESSVTWAPTPDQKSSEIDRIMAKIEQARLSIANVCVLIRITWKTLFLNTVHWHEIRDSFSNQSLSNLPQIELNYQIIQCSLSPHWVYVKKKSLYTK